MLEKIITPYDYVRGNENPIRLWEETYHTPTMLDLTGLSKQAAMDVSDIKYEPDFVKIHVIALGSGEYWGSNRNGDYFPKASLEKYHPTFVDFGNFHKNHKNKPSDPKYGTVEKSWYNPKMHRVELVVAVDLTRYPEFKEKLEGGQDIAVSMAAKLPYDVCSICGHKRTKPGREYSCKHINDELTSIYPDGRQVYAINLEPKFFDISEVWKPADRTAYVLRKVARAMNGSSAIDQAMGDITFKKQAFREEYSKTSQYAAGNLGTSPYVDGAIQQALDLSQPLHRTSHIAPIRKMAWSKMALLNKLSELEKQIEGELSGKVEDGKIKALKNSVVDVNIPDEVLDVMTRLPKATAYASLADKGIILRPKEFLRLNLGEDAPEADSIAPLLKGIFSKLDKTPDLEEHMSSDFDLESVPEHSKVSEIFKKFISARSILPEDTVNRTVIVMMTNLPKVDDFSVEGAEDLEKESNFNRELALLYGLYKASALEYILNRNGKHELNTSNVPAVSAILENYV